MATTPKPKRIGPFPRGMDTRVPDFEMKLADGGHLLRDALNVDVTDGGSLKTRQGYARAVAGADCHSLWAPLHGRFALYVDSGNLYRLDSTMARTLIATGYGAMTPLRYAAVNEAVYFTDGLRTGSYHPTTGPTPPWANVAPSTVGEQALVPMPPGQHIAYHGARLLVAVGSVLIFSEPFTPTLRDESRGFELFPAPITCLVAVEGGVFVVADQTYFIAGGLPAQTVRPVLAYGAPEQQPGYRQDGGAHWMSAEGIVSCNSAGELANLQDERLALRATGAAATAWRQADGAKSIVAALSSPSGMGAGIGSYAEARIVKKDRP